MTETPVHQIEFRWHPDYDLTAIAASFGTSLDTKRWNDLLKQYAGISSRGRTGAADSSAVYLTSSDGKAALILRSQDAAAMTPGGWAEEWGSGPRAAHGAGAGRLDMVARALIADQWVLTAELAMRIAGSDLRHMLHPPPGRVRRGVLLPSLDAAWLQHVSTGDFGTTPRSSPLLVRLIAAVLRNPGQPLTVVLDPKDLHCPLPHNRALELLWASRRVLGPMLAEDGGGYTGGWQPTFSTCEAPLSSGDERNGLWISFRERPFDTTPLGDGPQVVFADRALERRDEFDHAAFVLAAAYETVGDDVSELIGRVVEGSRSLPERVETVSHDPQIEAVLGPRRTPPTPSGPEHVRAPREHSHSIREHAHSGRAPAHRPHDDVAVPAQAGPPPSPGGPGEPGPPGGQRPVPAGRSFLIPLYARLGQAEDLAEGLADFRWTLDWIGVQTRHGHRLPAQERAKVIGLLRRRDWFVSAINRLDRPPDRMADLLQPLFMTEAGHVESSELQQQVASWLRPGRHSLIRETLPILVARLEPHQGAWLTEQCLAPLTPDSYGSSHAGGRSADSRGAMPKLLLGLLRLPNKLLPDKLRDEVTGGLVWLSALVIVVLLVMWI